MQRLIETLAFVSILFTFHILYTHLGQPFNLSLNLQLFSEGSFNFFPTKLSILFCFLTSFLAQMVYQQNSKKFSNPTPNSITHLWTLWIFSDRIGKLLCCTSKTFKIITEAGITKIARKLVERSTFCPRQLWLLPKNLLSSLVS
jgi:hypothetical protein